MAVLEDSKSSPGGKPFHWFWRLMIGIMLLTWLFVSPQYLNAVIAREALYIEDTLGRETMLKIDTDTSTLFNRLAVSSGFAKKIEQIATFSDQSFNNINNSGIEKPLKKLTQWARPRLAVFMMELYLMSQRVTLAWLWLPFLVILFAQSIYSGLLRRKIKQSSFEFSSPTLNRGAISTLVTLFLSIPALLVVPVPINPYFLPLLFILLAVIASIAIGNLAKRL